jgi:3-phenylpropionate/cinnamic acid dioxygenase small subunit
MTTDTLLAQATELLYQEADLLDQADLDHWIELYTDDGTYWMPVTPEQTDPINHISLFYDDRTIMEIRRRNLQHPRAASKELPIRCSHIIGNVRLNEGASDSQMTARSNFHCVVYSNSQQDLYAGTYQHDLLRVDGQWRIQHKRVDLINCDATLGSILIYL